MFGIFRILRCKECEYVSFILMSSTVLFQTSPIFFHYHNSTETQCKVNADSKQVNSWNHVFAHSDCRLFTLHVVCVLKRKWEECWRSSKKNYWTYLNKTYIFVLITWQGSWRCQTWTFLKKSVNTTFPVKKSWFLITSRYHYFFLVHRFRWLVYQNRDQEIRSLRA